ncbi:MAG: stage V sporulation protein AB [Lachnospiraceae bacterium]
MNQLFYGVIGLSFGGLAASGVLTVLVAVGLVPRFIGRVHEAKHIITIENTIIAGTLIGTLINLFGRFIEVGSLQPIGLVIEVLYGTFSGVFVGCLALAIAEMLDAIPIYFRRFGIRDGIPYILLSIACGKLVGSYLYFYWAIYQSVQ